MESPPFTPAQICKAAISALMNRDPAIITSDCDF
jgi:hypothetical protein